MHCLWLDSDEAEGYEEDINRTHWEDVPTTLFVRVRCWQGRF